MDQSKAERLLPNTELIELIERVCRVKRTQVCSWMATGGADVLLSHRQGLDMSPSCRHEASSGGSRKKKPAVRSSRRRSRRCRDDKTKPPTSHSTVSMPHFDSACMENYFKRLPPEIILKIFSYLDAPSLFCVGFVNRQFYELANDNVMWYELYTCEMGRRKWRSGLCETPDSNRVDLQDVPARVWKKLLLSEMGCHDDMVWKKELRYVNLHTGMPELTEQVLRSQQIVWELTLCKLGGKQIVYSQSQVVFFDSSVAVYWSSGKWPRIQQVYSMQVHGVLGSSTTMPAKPQWRSLISKTVSKEMKWKHIGVDSLVKLLKVSDGITVGVWRGTWEIAFIMSTLHHHKLVERSVLGSLFCTYRAEEISPLHTCLPEDFCVYGYTVVMLLHNSRGHIVKCRYSPVFCTKDKIHSGFVYLQPVKISISQKHTLIPDEISFSWKTDKLWGDIKNCCMMTVSVLNEARKPVWCISTSAAIVPHQFNTMCDNYEGEQFVLWCEDAHGKLKMILVWMQDLHVYCIISLHIWNCCMMTVSVLNEARKPVWCISTSAAIVPHQFNTMCDNYEGEQFVLWCEDAHGKLKMILVWMQDLHVYCIISLHIWVREENINTCF